MPIRKSRITKVLMWAMIPLIVFGSLPRMGCICADGQHKTFCQRHLQGTKAGGCVCCEGRTAATDGCRGGQSTAPSAKHACCQGPVEKCSSDCPSLGTGRPCRLVVDRTEIVTAAKSVLDLDQVNPTQSFVVVQSKPRNARPVVAAYNRGELLPPPDLVVTLGVWLI